MGRFHLVLFVLLQKLSRRVRIGQPTSAWVKHFKFKFFHTNVLIEYFFFVEYSYSVGPPGFQDAVQKEFVFKLSFKNHVYFFRAESEHTYNRWMEVLRSTTQTQDFKNTRGTM